MDEFDKKFEKLKAQLINENFPLVYMFKFITPQDKVSEVMPLFEEGDISTRRSSKGNYVSITVKMVMFSADHIIEKYRAVSHIKGVISL